MADGEAPELLGQGRRRRANARTNGTRSPNRALGLPEGRGGQQANCRYDSSLGLLTKKFVTLVESAEDGVLDLNKAAESLSVQKRRIYDITNVLEGIGLIEKKSKNNIKWKGSSGPLDEPQGELRTMMDEVAMLRKEYEQLENHIEGVKASIEQMSAHPVNKSRIYVTSAEILALPSVGNDTVFAVTAPQGTTLSVPNPQDAPDGFRYRADLRSMTEPIEVWLVSKPKLDAGTASASTGGGLGQGPGGSVGDGPLDGMGGATLHAHGALPHSDHPCTPTKVKREDMPLGDQAGGLGAMAPGLMSPISPGGFMRLAAVDVDAYWYDAEDTQQLGVADIFKDDPALTEHLQG